MNYVLSKKHKLKNIKNCILLLLFAFIYYNANSQNYLKNLNAYQEGDNIILKYDLKFDNKKGYADPKSRTKTRKFEVKLMYFDNQKSKYVIIDNAKGKVGKYVRTGNNKKITWLPTSQKFGNVGEMEFKIEATPIIPKWSWGISYVYGIHNFGDLENTNAATYTFSLYHSLRNGGSIFFPISFIDAFGEYNYERYSSYSSVFYTDKRTSDFKAITIGIGIQSNKRIFSFHAGLGPMQEHYSTEESEIYDSGKEIYFSSKGKGNWIILNGGICLKLIDLQPFTILVPINLYVEPADLDFLYLSSGVSIQF